LEWGAVFMGTPSISKIETNKGNQFGNDSLIKNNQFIINNTVVTPVISFSRETFKEILKSFIKFCEENETLQANVDIESIFENKRKSDQYMRLKNIKNQMSEQFFNGIVKKSINENFDEIEQFLKNIRQSKLQKKYNALARQLTNNYFANIEKFKGIEDHMQHVYNEFFKNSGDSCEGLEYIDLILNHMYWVCDYGLEVDENDNT